MTAEDLAAAVAGRDAGALVLEVGPGFGLLELLRLATPLGLRVAKAELGRDAWRLTPLQDWIRERDRGVAGRR